MSKRTRSWPVPFMRSLDKGLDVGHTLFLKGVCLGERFDINLQCSDQPQGADIAMHLSCRVSKEKKFCVNDFRGGNWGSEERHSTNFKEGDEFDIRIRCMPDFFEVSPEFRVHEELQVYSQGKEVFQFKHRLPIASITHVFIEGSVEIHHVSWEGRVYEMPFSMPIKLSPGKSIFISGVVEKRADKFEVDLKSGSEYALHFNPRFGNKAVIRNHTKGGEWQTEDRSGEFPLKKDRTFDIIINVTNDDYDIYLEGEPYCKFPHFHPLSSVDQLSIEGDIELQGVHWD